MLKYFKLQKIIPRFFSSGQVVHTPDHKNTTSHIFNFSPQNENEVLELLKKYPSNYKKSAVIPVLFIAQKQNDNFLSLSAMQKVAEVLEMSYMDVYEVASFYTMFNRTKVGKFHLQICGTTPCMVRGSEKIIEALENHLDCKLGHTSKDGMFTLQEVECLGACANAPMIQINNEWVYEDLDEQNVIELVDNLRNGIEVKKGPQTHRLNSEGPLKRTTLTKTKELNKQGLKFDRDFVGEKKKYLEKKEEEKRKKEEEQRKQEEEKLKQNSKKEQLKKFNQQ